jgi:hypothetical protein
MLISQSLLKLSSKKPRDLNSIDKRVPRQIFSALPNLAPRKLNFRACQTTTAANTATHAKQRQWQIEAEQHPAVTVAGLVEEVIAVDEAAVVVAQGVVVQRAMRRNGSQ